MPSAKEAKEWSPGHLKGIFDALYSPFCGKDGDEIDYKALRAEVNYCLGTLNHQGIYCNGTVGEFGALTVDERKKIAEVAIDEANKVNPKAIKIVMTSSIPVKDAVELTQHAQQAGADMATILTPYVECHGGRGAYDFYKYISDRTDIGLAVYNSPTSGYILSPEEIAELYNKIPGVCAIKNGLSQPEHSVRIHRLVPKMVIWEANIVAAGHGGLMKYGITSPVLLGTTGYHFDIPGKMLYTEHWNLIMEGKLTEAIEQWYSSGLQELNEAKRAGMVCPYRPGYHTHWGSVNKYVASLLGMPVGDFPHSRPPQTRMPEDLKQRIREIYVKVGFIKP